MARRAQLRFTGRRDGDLRVDQPDDLVAARRRAVVDLPWTWLRQVHGAEVVTVTEPGGAAGAEADGAVTAVRGAVLAVHTADCAPVAILGDRAVGVAHAGWRGLRAGVVEQTVRQLRELDEGPLRAHVGPCIGPECYEFGVDELGELAAALGPGVRATTSEGTPALDLRAAVGAALRKAGVVEVEVDATCTACGRLDGEPLFSHRARGDVGRHALVTWLT